MVNVNKILSLAVPVVKRKVVIRYENIRKICTEIRTNSVKIQEYPLSANS